MAIAYTRVTIHTRSKGHSAVAGAAYRAGEKLFDERTGETFDFTKRSDIIHSEILLPDGADYLLKDRAFLWNKAEAVEKRKDAQIAKDVVLALPREVDKEQQIALARNFAEYHFVYKGVAVDLAIHDHSEGNPHAHLYVTTRRLIGKEFDIYKARDLNPIFSNGRSGKGFITEQEFWGERWRDFQTGFFKEHGLELIVDENHIISQAHEGKYRVKNGHYLSELNQLRREAAREIALSDPDNLINILSHRHAVFSEKQLASLIFKSVNTPQEFQIAFNQIKQHKDIICLGIGDDNQLRYSTRANFRKEARLIRQAEAISLKKAHAISTNVINKIAKQMDLSKEKHDALKYIVCGQDIALIVGHAGTGKSYLMKAAEKIWSAQGYKTFGMAVAGVAARELKEKSNIPSSTIASFKKRLLIGKLQLKSNHIVVMDEAGMTNLEDMAFIINEIKRAHAKLILIGDPNQLQPIGGGAPFRAISQQIGFCTLQEIHRQKDPLDRVATKNLAQGNVEKALEHYASKHSMFEFTNAQLAMEKLIADWSQIKNKDHLSNIIILAHRNQDIRTLNLLARERLISQGLIHKQSHKIFLMRKEVDSDGFSVKLVPDTLLLTAGDRILFKENNSDLELVNGDFGTIKSIKNSIITAQLDNEKIVHVDSKKYQALDYGYAATVHKAQGITKEKVFIYTGGQGWDKHLTYVALSRHERNLQIYWSHSDYQNKKEFYQKLGRSALNDSSIDWPITFAERRGFDSESLIGRLFNKLGKALSALNDPWREIREKTNLLDKEGKINWESKEVQLEIKKLSVNDHHAIKWLLRFNNLLHEKTNVLDKERIIQSMDRLIKELTKPACYKFIMAKAPNFAEKLKQSLIIIKQKERGRDKS